MTALCPECRAGKPDNCTGMALDDHDDFVDCDTAALPPEVEP